MNTKTLCALTAIFVTTLISANFNVASAETTSTVNDNVKLIIDIMDKKRENDKRALETIEKKHAEAASKIVSILQEYEQTLKQHKFANPSTEKRVMDNANSIQNKITGIIELLENRIVTKEINTPSEPYLKKIAQGKLSTKLPDYKVTYQVFAADYNLNNVQVMVSSDLDSKQQAVGNIFAKNSNKATFLIKASDPNSITAEIVS